ncbi:hypothetical protein [Acinetobacter sp. WZC-1]|uniref:hypothetical protein n=1 Tax=Acinetobacter sp. WZC-1 TaxID=3459034 RepID=UPI00403DC330
MDTKKFTAKLSAIAISILLVSCGGGGSEGYYRAEPVQSPAGNGSENGSEGSEGTIQDSGNYYVNASAAKTALLLTGDTAVLNVKLLDADTGGAISGGTVKLQIVNAQALGASFEGTAEQTTDENGYAVYTVRLAQSSNRALLSDGIQIRIMNAEDQQIGEYKFTVVESEAEKPLYDLFIQSNKNNLSVKGDNAFITVKALDAGAGSLAGQTVSLAVLDYDNNRVTIEGPSTGVTDQYGNAGFNIRLPMTTGSAATALMSQGISLEATITDPNGVKVMKPLKLNVIEGNTVTPVGNITFGNSNELSSNPARTFYSENFSAQVVDIDGKPLKDQKVTMTIDIVSGTRGQFVTGETVERLRNADILDIDIRELQPLQQRLGGLQSELVALNSQLAAGADELEKRRIQGQIDAKNYEISMVNNSIAEVESRKSLIERYEISPRTQVVCGAVAEASNASLATSLVDQNNNEVANEYTYTTDASGKFDFKVNYLRRYAGWQTVQIRATSTVSGKTIESAMIYVLNATRTDMESVSGQPFDSSPYGSSGCSFIKPWTALL